MRNIGRLVWGVYYPMIKKKFFATGVYGSLGVFALSLGLYLGTSYQLFAVLMGLAIATFYSLGAWAVIAKHIENFKQKKVEGKREKGMPGHSPRHELRATPFISLLGQMHVLSLLFTL